MNKLLYRDKGQLGWAIFLLLLVITAGIGSFAVDIAQAVSVEQQLQSAVDAGALAGAVHLTNADVSQAESEALSTTALNTANGAAVSSASPGTVVSTQATLATNNVPGSITVTAQKQITHLFSPIFGRKTDVLTASATAGGLGTVVQVPAGNTFPIAVSIDGVPDAKSGLPQVPLKACGVGQQFTIYIGNQNDKNAAFTSFDQGSANVNYFRSAMSQYFGVTNPSPSVIPSIAVGTVINLNNGEGGYQSMSNDFYTQAMTQPYLVMPIIQGSPPFNQSTTVIGFFAMKITSITKIQGVSAVTGTIVKPAILGQAGDTWTGSNSIIVESISPLTVRLIR